MRLRRELGRLVTGDFSGAGAGPSVRFTVSPLAAALRSASGLGFAVLGSVMKVVRRSVIRKAERLVRQEPAPEVEWSFSAR